MLPTSKLKILTDEIVDEIAVLGRDDQRDYLFLEPHPDLPGRWYVDSLYPEFFMDYEEMIGQYRTVSPAGLQEFLEFSDEAGYHVYFTEDPLTILSAWDDLDTPPSFSLNSDMPEVVNGFLPFQLQGFNALTATERAGLAVWSTGTGKTALLTGLIKQHLEAEAYDLAIVVCKKNNKIDTQKKILKLGDIDYSVILDGVPSKRKKTIDQVTESLYHNEPVVLITNYETFKTENDAFVDLITGRRVVIFWDEMPTKLSNRETQLYRAVRHALYKDSSLRWEKKRAEDMKQYVLSATPIENSPVGVLNQIRLVDPTIWTSWKEWETKFGAGRDWFSKQLNKFKDLDLMGLEIAHITHQVDKDDPDIAKYFPKVREEVIYVDWSPQDRKTYDAMLKLAVESSEGLDEEVQRINALQLIGVLQMICDAPSMVQKSAENREEFEDMLAEAISDEEYESLLKYTSGSDAALTFLDGQTKPLTDEHCNKLDALCDLITVKHPDEKFLVFSRLAKYIHPVVTKKFEERGISYVIYRGTEKQRQEIKDEFRENPEIQVFFTSDIGSDSIDLPEARINVNYDLPLTHARKLQRGSRNHRVNSEFDYIIRYDLLMPDSVEDRIAEIVEKKRGYHQEIFKGEIAEEAISARMTQQDLWYILTGEN